ncbi:unnamed protein product, partial [Closterium sp. NIES-53]
LLADPGAAGVLLADPGAAGVLLADPGAAGVLLADPVASEVDGHFAEVNGRGGMTHGRQPLACGCLYPPLLTARSWSSKATLASRVQQSNWEVSFPSPSLLVTLHSFRFVIPCFPHLVLHSIVLHFAFMHVPLILSHFVFRYQFRISFPCVCIAFVSVSQFCLLTSCICLCIPSPCFSATMGSSLGRSRGACRGRQQRLGRTAAVRGRSERWDDARPAATRLPPTCPADHPLCSRRALRARRCGGKGAALQQRWSAVWNGMVRYEEADTSGNEPARRQGGGTSAEV